MTPPPDDRETNGTVFVRSTTWPGVVWACIVLLGLTFPSAVPAQETGFAALAEKLMGSGAEWGQTIDLNDPCPATQEGSPPPPDDLSSLQADIDRFTLCAERAEMLKRLNDATLDKDAGNGEEADTTPENPGFRLRTPTAAKQKQPLVPPVSEDDLKPPPGEASGAVVDPGEWVIVNIFGSGQGLQVRLRKADGSVAQAKTGTVLPDGWTVQQVSTSGVALTKGGQDKLLTWMD